MRTVRDEDGNHYLLVKESAESSRVRDPVSGTERYLDNDNLTVLDGESPLETAAKRVPENVRRLVTAVHDERSLGLLVALADSGPTSARELLGEYDLCESDFHGLLGEFRAARLVEETTVYGERGYVLRKEGREAIEALQFP